MSSPRIPYAGIATRAVALGIDALLSQAIFVTGAALFGLIGSLVGEIRPSWIVPVLVAAGWALTVVCYFVGFWAVAGQTPGMRLMHVRVLARDGAPPGTARGIVRLIGLGLAIIPLFAGFLPVLVDNRRRGLADFLAGTVVVYADREIPLADLRPAMSLVERDMTSQSS
jgi:uncharacterized RDD family membrane protein YckC